jgi:hypothetical protein
MAATRLRVPIDVHLNGDLGQVTKTLTAQGVSVSEPVTAAGPMAVLMQLVTPADVPAGAVVRPVVIGSSVVGFHVETSEAEAELRQAVFGRGQQPAPSTRRGKSP